ncbi:alcohol dehydrogenase catalytic domain-containing protein [Paenibacillus sacheonensis]|uniref:Alcohol dehydrogenase catalytic domain-containing protein n=1 Tax=Paenibacillus sacheonensis TaxID=742054 RepID=A0A7X4YPU3_9BACL|nr:alcohol dehydrogenase catalytic domain-containing protein [Paenibacillus sacheonensis]MBM7564924.1 threonine dehydrogenase-like Zn-dependent dehydrogenase [Paenibacillus sacheonensis]NBC70287.1 alcohol dehydrogenase catalytic domain-containing protein [Paenibacillus sacheonensis]
MQPIAIPAQMLSPVFTGNGEVAYVTKDVPRPGPGQLLIRSKANALCGSDKGYYLNGSGQHTPGHEIAGFVVDAGPNTNAKPGTPGVVFLMDFCGQCRSCKLGYTNQCFNKRADMGFSHDGGYGEYVLINENIFFPIDADLSFSDATLLLDIMGTGGHATRRATLAREDIESVLITGAGPIGLGILGMVKIMLGQDVPVYVTDMNEYRLALAKKLGGIPVHAGSEDLAARLAADGFADGVDAAFDSSGQTSARQLCVQRLGKRGVLVCVGHGGEVLLDVSSNLIAPERTVLGSEYFTYGELEANAAYLRQHREYLSQIITHRFPASQLQEASELFFGGQCGKVVVEP